MKNLEGIGKYVYDVEIYPNYFCVVLKALHEERIYVFDSYNFKDQKQKLYQIIQSNILISYGGHGFDDRVLEYLSQFQNKSFFNFSTIHQGIKNIHKQLVFKNQKYNINSFDIAKELKSNVGIKGFTFNIGEHIIDHSISFNRPVWKNQVERVIYYCISDVYKTEKLYNIFLEKYPNFWREKVHLFENVFKQNSSFTQKEMKSLCLKYSNEELAALSLQRASNLIDNLKEKSINTREQAYINRFLRTDMMFNNKKKSKIWMLSLEEDYLYQVLIFLQKKDKIKLPKVDVTKFNIFTEDYKKNLYEWLTNPRSTLFDKKESIYIKRIRNIIFAKIKKQIQKRGAQVVAIEKENFFVDGILKRDLKKMVLELRQSFQSIIKIDGNPVENFIRLNKEGQDMVALINGKVLCRGLFEQGIFINPSKHKWLAQVLKVHYWERKSIEEAVLQSFEENPEDFFMYYSTLSKANLCDSEGKILEKTCLELDKKYRVYYSKTGFFKPTDRRKMKRQEYKYYTKYGIGDVNNCYFKMRYTEVNLREFKNYEDFDLESYIFYANNFIEKTASFLTLKGRT